MAEIGAGGLTGRERVVGEAVAEIGEGEVEALSQLESPGQGRGLIGKELGHLPGLFEVALAVRGQQPAGGIELGVLADTGEDVVELLVLGTGVAHTVGGHQGEP